MATPAKRQPMRQGFLESAFQNNPSAMGLLSQVSKNAEISEAPRGTEVVMIPTKQIVESPFEKRVYPELREIESLALDISKRGIQTPLKVIPQGNGKDGEKIYEIVSGHRRRLANQIAVEKFGYEKGKEIPCIIQERPAHDYEVVEDIILDNSQRNKSDAERMLEIINFMDTSRKRKEAGEDIPNVRDRVMERLGVSNSEITRYEKIYSSLDKTLMKHFYSNMIPSTVAYEVARLTPECQEFIAAHWDPDEKGSLSRNLVSALAARYNRAEQVAHDTNNETKEEPPQVHYVKPKNLDEGVSLLNKSFDNISKSISQEKMASLDRKVEQKVLRKIIRQVELLDALRNELASLGVIDGAGDGEE